MSKYIKVSDATELCRKILSQFLGRFIHFNEAIKIGSAFKELPSIDIDEASTIEPKRGEWVNHDEPCVGGGYWHYVMCTACKEKAITPTNFCPNCGARMKGADDE